MPTKEQLESRKQLSEFIERASRPMRNLGARLKSEWFGRPDDELKGWIERGRAIGEIADTRGYQLIFSTLQKEIEWARNALEAGTKNDAEIRGYLKGCRFVKDFILTTERNADISSSVLAGRESAIGRDTASFVKNARVEN
jgi:hypothetical protein